MAEFLNLSALAKVAPTRVFGRLADAIRQYQHACSALMDLNQAIEAVATLEKLLEEGPDNSAVEAALATSTVILYARAVHSASTARVKIDIRSRLGDPKLVAIHDSLASLRDDSLAHFGKGKGKHGSGWISEFVAAELLPDGNIDVALPSRRRNHHPELLEDIGQLLPVVYILLTDTALTWGETIKKEWGNLPREKNKEIDLYLKGFGVDPVAFLGLPAEKSAEFYSGITVYSNTPGK